jgi:Domain of unknown function (DUF4383)
MIKRAALIFGWVFLLVGIMGFIPALRTGVGGSDGYLLGIFAVDSLHNWVHTLTGAAALAVGYRSEAASQLYFKIFGIVYALVALLGFVYGNSPLLGIMAHNMIDAVFHLLIAAVALYLGFVAPQRVLPERTA